MPRRKQAATPPSVLQIDSAKRTSRWVPFHEALQTWLTHPNPRIAIYEADAIFLEPIRVENEEPGA